MKTFYLSKGEFTHEFYLDSGAFGSRREILGKDEDFLISSLKDKLDMKRKSELYILKEDVSPENVKQIRKFFSDSKIKVSLESKNNLD